MHPALLLLKPFAPYLGLAAVIGGAWWWHSSAVSGLEDQIVALDKNLSTCQLAKANQTTAYANALTDAAKRVNDEYQKALENRVTKERERADLARRIARTKQREAEAARVNLDVLRRQWDAHGHVCPVPDRTPGLLDFAAQATRSENPIRDPGVPKAPATSDTTGKLDAATRRAAEAL